MPRNRSPQLTRRHLIKGAAATSATLLLGKPAIAKGKTEIVIGNIDAYSGPAAVYSSIGRTPGGYFKMINEQGGINGRMIRYITYDDAYSPAKTVEQARKLVEGDEIDVLFAPLGAPTNAAIMKYMNQKKVPHLFIASGATKFGDYKNFPYTMGFQPCYQIEGRAFAQHVLSTQSDPKIGIVYQNDDFGRDVLKGFKDGLGAKASAIVAELSYETADPTIDSQVVRCKSAGANVFMSMTTPKFAAQGIKKIAELGWQPAHYIGNNASSAGSTLKAAGFDVSKGIISSAYLKDPVDAAWDSDPAIQKWRTFLDKYDPAAAKNDIYAVTGYLTSQILVQVLKQCGDDVSPESIIKQAANLRDVESDMLLPGIKINTSPTDYYPLEQLQLTRFSGERYEPMGPVIDGGISKA
ncbi:ABC transporter substrate-binding protein [Bradyrhizobium erythrophlei]|uniref:ABC-type branched-chain amino acid transport system, substrate-binding protein n=1 Tax=Bradyrhizobium erythrophlei TaxID=1437360 RepID=A0A1H4T029_9BRAD|nr:ABC transporter substrate-binding protein [Bradyrhizobium erythrophlei]SEC49639.1 ABC-type branched-chain amino acid transport system, substrate-binding protein [Bradyrhizobium erythrophlei]